MKKQVKEINYNEDLPTITIEKKKTVAGSILESEYYHVKGRTLGECKTYIDKITKAERKQCKDKQLKT